MLFSLIFLGGPILCYVHKVTPVMSSGKVKYTTCQLQTSNNALIKAICFSPPKHGPLRSAMEKKSPVKILNFDYNEKFSNVVIKNKSSITILNGKLSFALKESMESEVLTLDSLSSTVPEQLVTVKANVDHISGVKTIKMENKTLKKSSATLVDPTGSITGVFWEEWASCLQAKKTYLFQNLRVKRNNYTKELYVNTAKEGFQVEMTEDFEEELAEPEVTVMEMTTKEIGISIIGIKNISSYYICSSCGKKAVSVGSLLKCEACKMKQKIMPNNKQWYAKLFVQNTATKEKFNMMVFHQHLLKMFECNDKESEWNGAIDEDKITDVLLESCDINVTYDITDNKLIQVNV